MRLYIKFWKRSFDFFGFSDVTEYFVPWIFHILIVILPFTIFYIFQAFDTYLLIIQVYFVLALIPIISSTLRRLYDNNVSRFNILWIFIPVIGQIFLITKLMYGSYSVKDTKQMRSIARANSRKRRRITRTARRR